MEGLVQAPNRSLSTTHHTQHTDFAQVRPGHNANMTSSSQPTAPTCTAWGNGGPAEANHGDQRGSTDAHKARHAVRCRASVGSDSGVRGAWPWASRCFSRPVSRHGGLPGLRRRSVVPDPPWWTGVSLAPTPCRGQSLTPTMAIHDCHTACPNRAAREPRPRHGWTSQDACLVHGQRAACGRRVDSNTDR